MVPEVNFDSKKFKLLGGPVNSLRKGQEVWVEGVDPLYKPKNGLGPYDTLEGVAGQLEQIVNRTERPVAK